MERPQRSYRPARRCTGNKSFNGRPQRYSVNACAFAERVHRCLADASRGDIQYAEQRNVILRMHCQADVSERILHFGAIVEAEPTHKFVAQAAPAENLFEGSGL